MNTESGDARDADFVTTAKQSYSAAPLWARIAATSFGIGHLRPGPGTWASAATILIWWLAASWIPPLWRPGAALLLTAAVVAIGIPAATCVARSSGVKDPPFVVIDEVAGQLLTVVGVPVSWKSLLLSFILFRVFDIFKPPPIRWLEGFRNGVGIVIDDIGAGLYALVTMHLLLHAGILR